MPGQLLSLAARARYIHVMAGTPRLLRNALSGLSDEQLDTAYRPRGWTVRQVVHHLADAHMHDYIRTRLALTEAAPTIKTYDEAAWAGLADVHLAPVELSLALLDAIHQRWTTLLRSLASRDFGRCFQHPEAGDFTIDQQIARVAWHGTHHTAQVTRLRARMGW
jgi:uncharacterized damage-inducible protein DinB